MNETYVLRDLLLFWQRQVRDDYKVIEAVISLLEFKGDNLPQSQREKVIVETLRLYGLFEIGFEGDRTFMEKVSPIPEPKTKPEEDIVWEHDEFETQIELYNIRLLNAVVEFKNFMN